MTGLVPVKENDLTSQIRDKLKSPAARGSFGQVYHCTDIETGKGKGEVAVKVFLIDDPRAKDPRAMEKFKKKMDRELKVWLRLEHRTIVPLLGIAHVESPLPALVSQWMSSGTLCVYLEKATLTVSAKGGLVKGVADGLNYLHSMNVIHGDLHPGNVLIDGSGNPCLTDFGLATIEGEGELQLSSTTAAHSLNPRWRAPEVIGVENDPENPTFMSDIYSFGGVMLFIVSGDFPWKKKQSYQICIALSHKAIHARPENILNNHWELIQKCWSWDPGHRPRAAGILQHIDQFRTDNSQDRQPKFPRQGLADLTGQIIVTVNDFVAAGDFAVVYKGEWKRPTGPIKVAVKVIKVHVPELDLQRLRREAENWAVLVHDNIIRLLGTTGFGPSLALVLPWFRSGTLLRLIAEQGAVLDIKSRLNLLHDVVSGLCHLHGLGVVHGDITSSNVLVDIKEGEYVACLTDIGLATVLGGCLGDRTIRGSDIRTGAIRWTAPELLKVHDSRADSAPTTQNDMYSFGRVMFHVITLVIPWNDINDIAVFQKILGGEDISRPVTPDMTTARWNEIAQCWSSDASARPSAVMAMDFLKSELEALADDDMSVDEVVESYRSTSFDAEQTTTSSNVMDPTRPISKAVQREIGLRTRDHRAGVDTVTLHPSQGGSSKRTTAACPDTVLDDHYNSNRQDAGNLTRNTKVLVSDPHQPPRSSNVHPTHSISKAAQSHSASASVNTVTPRTSQGESLRRPAAHADTIHQADHYNSTRHDTGNLTGNTKVPKCTDQPRNDDSQASIPNPSSLHALPLAEDLTGQIFGAISDYFACGAFGNVYRCEWRKPSGPVKVAVKSFRYHTSEQDLRRFRREVAIWAHLVHDNIVTLYGTTEGFGPTTALVSPWFPDGTLLRLITEQGATLTIRSKLKLLHGIASGLYYLHSFPVVHGDITSSNVLVELKDGEYKACLTDFGFSIVLGGPFKGRVVEGSTVRPGATRWTAPELLGSYDHPSEVKPTTQNDMYSYGRVMLHLLTLVTPWHDIDDFKVVQKILSREEIPRPEISDATSHVTDARWNQIEQCWSVDPSARPSALMAMEFVKKELEVVKQDETDQNTHWVAEQITASVPPRPRVPFQTTSAPTSIPSPNRAFKPRHLHLLSTASTLSLTGPMNVLLFGETGVGKSSIINLIMGRDAARTSPDAGTCTLTHTSYEVNLGTHSFKLWEVSSIESMGFFRSFFTKLRLKKAYKKLYKDDGVYLLLYCMRGSRAKRALLSDYKNFTDIVLSTAGPGRVPIAAVVTSLEDYPTDMDNWWTKNKDDLARLGMQFSSHACINSLPDDPNASSAMRARRHWSEQIIRKLIHDSYQAGRTHAGM